MNTFNGNYGLMRGLAAAILFIAIAAVIAAKGFYLIGGLIVLFLLALQRMHRFSKHYAMELFVQFLAITGSQ